MESTTQAPAWILPFVLVAFPVVFAGVWSTVCALLAVFSGYRSLSSFRIDSAEMATGESFQRLFFAMIGWVSYRGGVLSLSAGQGGLIVRVVRIFPFHPPLRIPWDRVRPEGDDSHRRGRWSLRTITLDGRVRLRLPEAAFASVIEAKNLHG